MTFKLRILSYQDGSKFGVRTSHYELTLVDVKCYYCIKPKIRSRSSRSLIKTYFRLVSCNTAKPPKSGHIFGHPLLSYDIVPSHFYVYHHPIITCLQQYHSQPPVP